MKDKDGNMFVIEVNGNPGTKIIGITDHNYFVDLVEMIEKKVSGGTVNLNRSVENSNVTRTVTQGAFIPASQINVSGLTQIDIEAREAWRKNNKN